MIEVEGTTARVSVGYSLKVPHEVDYATEDAHVSFSVEFPLNGEPIDVVLGQLEGVQAQLMNSVKLATFTQLGVEFEMSETGVVAPSLKARPKKAAAPARQAAPRQGGGGGSASYRGAGAGGGRQQYAPPKAAGRNLDTVVIEGITYYDQRPLKDDGTYAPGAADFKSVEKINGQQKQLWLYSKDGALNDGVADMLESAGIEF